MAGKPKWAAVLLAVSLATLGLAATAGADSGTEQEFLSAINSERSSRGLGTLRMDGGLQSHARNHTQDMIASGSIYHSSNSELQAAAGSGWTRLGENVGRGGSVSSLHQAFMDSSSHRGNILGDYNYVGIGADRSSDGVLYVTVVFMKKGSTTPTTTAPKATTTTSGGGGGGSSSGSGGGKPATTTTAPTTTTTTLPPTTTTTLIVGPDKPVTPGESCFTATRFGWMCHD